MSRKTRGKRHTRVDPGVFGHDSPHVLYIPEGFTEPPTTVVEVLRQAKALLNEELTRWMRGSFFVNSNPTQDINDPFCNGWSACAMGAVGVVTVGATPASGVYETPQLDRSSRGLDSGARALYNVANAWLVKAANAILAERSDEELSRPECGDPDCTVCAVVVVNRIVAAHEYNDNENWCQTRDDVDVWFDRAIQMAEEAATP